MKCSYAALAIIAPIVLAAPSPSLPVDGFDITDNGVKPDSDGGALPDRLAKRVTIGDFTVDDYGIQSAPVTRNEPSALEKRTTDGISSCGSNWVYVNSNADHTGYNAAVDAFCYHATHASDNNPTIIPPKSYYSVRLRNGLLLSHGNIPAMIDFEIHNKQDKAEHQVDQSNCATFLKAMSAQGQSCYGKKNDDTKGGTWQVGNNLISYHGLASSST